MTNSLLPQTNQSNNNGFWQKSLFKKAAVLSAVTLLSAGSAWAQCSIRINVQGSTSLCDASSVKLTLPNASTQVARFDDLADLTNPLIITDANDNSLTVLGYAGVVPSGYKGFNWTTGASNSNFTSLAGNFTLGGIGSGVSLGFTGITNGFQGSSGSQLWPNILRVERTNPDEQFDFLGAYFIATGNYYPGSVGHEEYIKITGFRNGSPVVTHTFGPIKNTPEIGSKFKKAEFVNPQSSGKDFTNIDYLIIENFNLAFVMDGFTFKAHAKGQWHQDLNGQGLTAISGAFYGDFMVNTPGTYAFRSSATCTSNQVTITPKTNGCKTARLAGPAAIGDVVKQTTLSAYPNPVSSVANVAFKLAAEGAYKAELVDLKGSVISVLGQGEGVAGQSYSVELSNKNLPAGIYMIRLVSASGVNYQKVMVN